MAREPFIINPNWGFITFLNELYEHHKGHGVQANGRRLRIIRNWLSMAGRAKAVESMKLLEREFGTSNADKIADELLISPTTYKGLKKFVENLPYDIVKPKKKRNSSNGIRKLFNLIKTLKSGDIVTQDEILSATDWSPNTLSTHLGKHKLDEFFSKNSDDTLTVNRNGNLVNYADIHAALTQTTSSSISLIKNLSLSGERQTYKLIKKLGEGATAHVWSAKAEDGEIVAIKIVNPRRDLLEPTIVRNIEQRFRREGENGQRIISPHVIHIKDQGYYRRKPFIVMEHANGCVKDILKSKGKFDIETSLKVISDTISGLSTIHKAGCIHRDIKPGNILISSDRYILGDLGIVKWSDLNPAFIDAGTITRSSMELGSFHYTPPEQLVKPQDATEKCDIYSLGVTWYELLTNDKASPHAFAAGQAPDPSNIESINSLIRVMTSYNPIDRLDLQDIASLLKNYGFEPKMDK